MARTANPSHSSTGNDVLLRLSRRDAESLRAALDVQPEPNDALKHAAARQKCEADRAPGKQHQ
jgi:uncharacterized protein (DUF1778 family)